MGFENAKENAFCGLEIWEFGFRIVLDMLLKDFEGVCLYVLLSKFTC